MKIYIDDGSTNIKLQWNDGGEVNNQSVLTALNVNGRWHLGGSRLITIC